MFCVLFDVFELVFYDKMVLMFVSNYYCRCVMLNDFLCVIVVMVCKGGLGKIMLSCVLISVVIVVGWWVMLMDIDGIDVFGVWYERVEGVGYGLFLLICIRVFSIVVIE